MKKIYNFLDRHPMWHTLFSLRGNARACLYPEPMWGIPYSLYAPFATLFMYRLGIKDAEIGIILSVGMIFQVLASLFGGIASDKLGRKRTTFVFDIASWSAPCLIWALSQNFWWFLAAQVVNSMWQITNNSWNCLLVEDTNPKQLVHIYSWCTISGLVSAFLAPVSSVMVSYFGVVPTVRGLYVFSFLMMTAKFIIVNIFAVETTQGRARMQETKNVPIWKMMSGYGEVFFKMFRASHIRLILSIMVMLNITSMVSGSFFSLYITQNLGIPESFLGYYPIARAAVMLVFIFTVQHRVDKLPFRIPMGAGLFLYIASQCVLLLAPPANYAFLLVVILLEAFGYVLIVPRKDSLLVTYLDQKERARMIGLAYVIMIGCTSPFGWLVGILSEYNRMLPFFLNTAIYFVLALIVIFSKTMKEKADTAQH
jgi:MFS family permease